MTDPTEIPESMRLALEDQDEDFAAEMIERYLTADEATRADIEAFFESDGPQLVHESKLKVTEGTPTSADLENWAGGLA